MTNNWYETLPKKRMGVGVLFFDESDRLLIVKPDYKDHWSIPGGTIDANESPRAAAIREVKEEVGLEVPGVRFLCIDYVHATPDKSENLQFIFHGGILTQEQIATIQLDGKELAEWRFASIDEARPLLSQKLATRIPHCLAARVAKSGIYLESGQSV